MSFGHPRGAKVELHYHREGGHAESPRAIATLQDASCEDLHLRAPSGQSQQDTHIDWCLIRVAWSRNPSEKQQALAAVSALGWLGIAPRPQQRCELFEPSHFLRRQGSSTHILPLRATSGCGSRSRWSRGQLGDPGQDRGLHQEGGVLGKGNGWV
eukprot:16452376-Heterocapsa_arctica.AAC.1